MKQLWNGDVKLATVHVKDLCRAVLYSLTSKKNSIYNVSDEGHTDLETINRIISKLIGVDYEFYGNIYSYAIYLTVD